MAYGGAPALNLLAAAKRVWSEVASEIKPAASYKEGPLLPAEELKKVCKWLANSVTKFGASAAVVADQEEAKKALSSMAEELIKAFTALVGTLLAMSSGAGPTLAKEMRGSGESLAEALQQLGMAVCTPNLAGCAGKVLEQVGIVERCSTKNRAALTRRFLRSLAQLRDANREMNEELDGDGAEVSGDDEELQADEDDFQPPPMDPSERILLENVLKVSALFEDIVKQASTRCIEDGLRLEDLEAMADVADAAAGAVDALAADSVGGTDLEACKASLAKLKHASSVLTLHFTSSDMQEVMDALEASILAQE